MNKVAIVTVTYNSGNHLDGFFQSLENQDYTDFFVVLVDNNSSDSSVEKAKSYSKQSSYTVIIVENKDNYGVAKANNLGYQTAIDNGVGDSILFLNNDVTFDKNFLFRLCSNNRTDAIYSPIILDGNTSNIWYKSGCFNKRRLLSTEHHDYGKGYDGLAIESPQRVETEYAPTTCLLVPLGALDEKCVGTFYEPYFCYYDDSDWVYRAKKCGMSIFVDHSAVLRHFEGGSSGGNRSPFSLYYLTRNRLIFIYRSLGLWYFLFSVLVFFAFIIATSFREKKMILYLKNRLKGWVDAILFVLSNDK